MSEKFKQQINPQKSDLSGQKKHQQIKDNEVVTLPVKNDFEKLLHENRALSQKIKTLENDLKKNHDIYENLPVAVVIVDHKGRIKKKNRIATLFFNNKKNSSYETPTIFTFIQNDSKGQFKNMLSAIDEQHPTQSGEITFILSDKRLLVSKINIAEYNAEEHTDRLYQLVITDIESERKRFSEELLASESRYRELAENINEGIYLTERSYITMVNKPLLNLLGYEMEEVLGKKVWEFVVPEKRFEVRKMFIKKVENSDTTPVEIECLRKNGDRFWAEVKISIFKNQRKIFGVLANISDRKATEQALKESEEKYRSVVTAMNDGIILRDNKGCVLTWNRAAEKILDLKPEEIDSLLKINHISNAIHEDGTPFTPESHPAMLTIKTGKPQQHVVMGINNSKGTRKWITVNAEPIFKDGDENPSAVVTSFSDITLQKNTETKLREINAVKDKLFSIIAHDLKSPYNAQMAFLELLVEEGANYPVEQRKHFVKMLYNSARQSFSLLDNLLLWSRTQTGRIPFNPVKVSLDKIIEEVIKMHELTASLKQINLKFRKNGHPLIVNADQEMINTVLRNLISNAIKFTPTGGMVEIKCQSTEDEQIRIAVKDNGMGIEKKKLDHLFTSHEIDSTPGTENEKGTGLGLIICKEFVVRNGGNIWAKSSPGKGSVFFFTLKNASIQHKCKGTCVQYIQKVYSMIAGNDELRSDFEHHIAGVFRETFKSMNGESVMKFSTALNDVVVKHDVTPLKQFTRNFSFECIQRDQNQVNICLNEFEKLIDQLDRDRQKKMGKNENTRLLHQ
jgi:PAS domain S-box-containing protein